MMVRLLTLLIFTALYLACRNPGASEGRWYVCMNFSPLALYSLCKTRKPHEINFNFGFKHTSTFYSHSGIFIVTHIT